MAASTGKRTGVDDDTPGKFVVPTKRHDGGSEQKDVVGETRQDAFSRYSNDLLRMKVILLNIENEDEEDDDDLSSLAAINQAMRSVGLRDIHLNHQGQQHNGNGSADVSSSKRRRGNNSRPLVQQVGNQRKTRISWEVHPSLLLHDLISEFEALDHDHCVSDEEDEEDDDQILKKST